MQAVKELDKMGGSKEEVSFVRDALSRRMGDDNPSVLLAVVSGKALLTLPPAEAVAAGAGLSTHARRHYSSPGTAKADKKVLRDVMRQVNRQNGQQHARNGLLRPLTCPVACYVHKSWT